MIHKSWFCYCMLSLVVTALGCGQSGNENLVPATGTILYNGTPVADASVVFRSEASIAFGMTDSSGRFELQTQGQGRGAEPGEYQVMVSKVAVVEAIAQEMDEAAANPVGEANVPKNELPAHYADPVKTPLEYTVTADEANDFNIELTD